MIQKNKITQKLKFHSMKGVIKVKNINFIKSIYE